MCVCVCDTEASIMRGPWPTTRLSTMGKKNPISDNKLLSLDQGVTLLLLFAGYQILLYSRALTFATVLQGNISIAVLPSLNHTMSMSLPVHCSLLSNHSSLYAFRLLRAVLSKRQKNKGSRKLVGQ